MTQLLQPNEEKKGKVTVSFFLRNLGFVSSALINNLAFVLFWTVFQCCSRANLLFMCMSQAVHCCHTNLLTRKPLGNSFKTLPRSRCTTHECMIRANTATASLQWNVYQRHLWSEALAWTTVLSSGWIWREMGRTSKTKSKSVSVLHGCQGLKGCPFNTRPRED